MSLALRHVKQGRANPRTIVQSQRLSRWWPHALYHYDYEKRSEAKQLPFLVERDIHWRLKGTHVKCRCIRGNVQGGYNERAPPGGGICKEGG